MLEIAGRFAIERLHGLYTQRSQQLGQDDATHRVDRIECHTEAGAAYGIHIHQLQREDTVDVFLVISGVRTIAAQ